ncbi:hypothetical protein [Nostoc sp. ChiQUE01b]|uniref:hypothetical protein n=1 Tax=Nostoc sp. ChiQUE01b TaxID=3075376 RepID=UPI002AD442C1|nr:hypothetical protein [Nostoc sp. ChiQUE01b]MDZ8260595.1 hypothetical protein [Nostoc sp. ChiQUE01b]
MLFTVFGWGKTDKNILALAVFVFEVIQNRRAFGFWINPKNVMLVPSLVLHLFAGTVKNANLKIPITAHCFQLLAYQSPCPVGWLIWFASARFPARWVIFANLDGRGILRGRRIVLHGRSDKRVCSLMKLRGWQLPGEGGGNAGRCFVGSGTVKSIRTVVLLGSFFR